MALRPVLDDYRYMCSHQLDTFALGYLILSELLFISQVCLCTLPIVMQVDGMPLTVAVGSTISVEGFTFMMAPAAAQSVKKALIGQGAVSMSPGAWETLRILQGVVNLIYPQLLAFNILEYSELLDIILTASARNYSSCGALTFNLVKSLTLSDICR